MISKSVGELTRAQNSGVDVKIVQKALNKWTRLSNGVVLGAARMAGPSVMSAFRFLLPEDGIATNLLVDRICQFQNDVVGIGPDGIISPLKNTIRKICPAGFCRPTEFGLRPKDSKGEGHFGASRDGGSRSHSGTDYKTMARQPVKAPMSGVITREFSVYNASKVRSKPKLKTINKGIEILRGDGTICKLFYVDVPKSRIGEVVWVGETIGTALSLQDAYPGITDHTHVEIIQNGRKLNPELFLKN